MVARCCCLLAVTLACTVAPGCAARHPAGPSLAPVQSGPLWYTPVEATLELTVSGNLNAHYQLPVRLCIANRAYQAADPVTLDCGSLPLYDWPMQWPWPGLDVEIADTDGTTLARVQPSWPIMPAKAVPVTLPPGRLVGSEFAIPLRSWEEQGKVKWGRRYRIRAFLNCPPVSPVKGSVAWSGILTSDWVEFKASTRYRL